MKRVCLIIHSLGIGGMERVMSELANDFAGRENVKVDLVLIGKKREIEYPLANSIFVHRPSFTFREESRNVDTFRTIGFLRRIVKEISPDTVLCFGEIWNNLVLLSLYGLSFPIYISDRSKPEKDLGILHNLLRDILYPCAAGYIAQTSEAKKVCLSNRWNNKVCVIGNPIREIPVDDHLNEENIVLTVGRLIKTKHFDQLIKMFLDLGNPEWKLVIVGGDAKKLKLSQELKKLIHKLNASNCVFLEGEQKAIEKYYNKSKIFAFTSSSEGFPNVVGEAMSAGLAVIAYDCIAGPSDMITDGESGYLIPLFNQQEYKKKLNFLMQNAKTRKKLGKRALKEIKNYSVERIADLFYNFITKSTTP